MEIESFSEEGEEPALMLMDVEGSSGKDSRGCLQPFCPDHYREQWIWCTSAYDGSMNIALELKEINGYFTDVIVLLTEERSYFLIAIMILVFIGVSLLY
jgi:hypothetical protein